MRLRQIKSIYLREWKEFSRDRISRVVVFVMPTVIMLIFGYGLALDIENVPMAIVDQDHTPASREISYKFIENRQYFDFKGFLTKAQEIEHGILAGRLRFGLVIPPKIEQRLKRGTPSEVQVLIDGSFPTRASVSKTYALSIINGFNLERLGKTIKRLPLKIETRYWFNENLKERNITVCGLLPIILSISPTIFASLLVVKEKERGSIYNIWTSAINKVEFLLGKQTFAVTISMINFFIIFLLAIILFQVPFKGNFFLFLFCSFLYILASTSQGLLISCFVNTQVVALLGTLFLSGSWTPIEAMPGWLRPLTYLSPLKYYIGATYSIALKGVGLSYLWPDLLGLTLLGSILFISTGYKLKRLF